MNISRPGPFLGRGPARSFIWLHARLSDIDAVGRAAAYWTSHRRQSHALAGGVLASCGIVLGCRSDTTGPGGAPRSNTIVWIAPGKEANGRPAADSTSVYFATLDHKLIAADRRDGTIRWTAYTDYTGGELGILSNVVATGSIVARGDYDVYAFDTRSGARKWVFAPEDQGIPGNAPGAQQILAENGIIYTGSGSGHVYALDAQTGMVRWIAPLSVDGNSRAYGPIADTSSLYVVVRHFTNPNTGELYALDKTNGNVRWIHRFAPTPAGSGPIAPVVLFEDFVLVGNDDGSIYALDRSSGDTRWTAPRLAGLGGPQASDLRPLAVAGSIVVAGSSTAFVTGYDAQTGAQLWQVNGGQGSSSNDLATDGTRVYVPYNNGYLAELDPQRGAINWIRAVPGAGSGYRCCFFPSPLADDTVFAPSTVGLVAITP